MKHYLTKGVEMLVLTLNKDNQIKLGNGITIQLGECLGSRQARVLIDAPKNIKIKREGRCDLLQHN